ncbi:MAG: VOC family protein [Pseudomonadota bacterium]|nr:VOC family protein [Pseudomonadota bacterium]
MEVARAFYEGKLGFRPVESDNKNYINYKSGDTTLLVYRSNFAGSFEATVATCEVGADLERIVNSLKKVGIAFEHYNLPNTRLSGDIHIAGSTKTAWCKDPYGNILCFAGA